MRGRLRRRTIFRRQGRLRRRFARTPFLLRKVSFLFFSFLFNNEVLYRTGIRYTMTKCNVIIFNRAMTEGRWPTLERTKRNGSPSASLGSETAQSNARDPTSPTFTPGSATTSTGSTTGREFHPSPDRPPRRPPPQQHQQPQQQLRRQLRARPPPKIQMSSAASIYNIPT